MIMWTEFFIIGLIGGLLGIFYRNCLKVEDMIFYWWYRILRRWVAKSKYKKPYTGDTCEEYRPNIWNKLLGFIAYPLGFCIYCSTTWITFFLSILYLSAYNTYLWQDIVMGVIVASGVQHIVVCTACRFLIHKHPDLDGQSRV